MEISIIIALFFTILILLFSIIRPQNSEIQRLQGNETRLEGEADKLNSEIQRLQEEVNNYWPAISRWYRQEQDWICENCGINLQARREFLDTHHVRGRLFNSPADLKALCIKCHSDQTQPVDHSFMRQQPRYGEWKDFMLSKIKDAFKAQIESESRILQLDPAGGKGAQFIDYLCCDYNGVDIQLSIWIGQDLDRIATNLQMNNQFPNALSTFDKLKANEDKIQWLFPGEGETVHYSTLAIGYRIGIRRNVDLSQAANWQATAIWARKNLERFFWIIDIHGP